MICTRDCQLADRAQDTDSAKFFTVLKKVLKKILKHNQQMYDKNGHSSVP